VRFALEAPPSRIDAIADWLPRIAVAVFFIAIVGIDKLSTDPRGPWVGIFARIGAGQWFRYVTGAVQIVGGLLVLIPRTAVYGATVLACTMIGAVVVQIVVFHSPASAVIPATILIGVAFVGWRAHPRTG
jgi:uncharacterized membrane protein YphA (DoxX/SURF4 family)